MKNMTTICENNFQNGFQNVWWTCENIIISITHQIDNTITKIGCNSLTQIIVGP